MKNSTPAKGRGEKKQRIVSSAHLVSPKSPELSEIEFGMIIATHAFNRWMIRCMNAAGAKDMTPVDVLVMQRSISQRHARRCRAVRTLSRSQGILPAARILGTRGGKRALWRSRPVAANALGSLRSGSACRLIVLTTQ
jgi:hypothetical protein